MIFTTPLERNDSGHLKHNCAASPDGPCDDCIAVRIGADAERARIVAWLRKRAAQCDGHFPSGKMLRTTDLWRGVADGIERGEHLEGSGDA